MNEIIKYDQYFNEEEFLSKVGNIYVMLCTSLMFEDLDRVKHFISEPIFADYQTRLNKLMDNNERQMFDELNVASSRINNVHITDTKIIIEVILISKYLDYIIDKKTNKIKSGNNHNRVEICNYLTLVKKRDAKKQNSARTCPSCGANMDINYNGKCSYCGTIYNTEDFDYILDSITNT